MAKVNTNMTKKDKLENYLRNGGAITEKMAVSRFKLKNLRATISDLREEGMNIKTTTNASGNLSYVKTSKVNG